MNEPAAPAEGFDRALRREQDPEFFDRQEEEARAARHSLPTRLLAWSMIAYQLLLLIAILFGKGGMVDLLTLYGSFRVLRGSQAWLRIFTFLLISVLPFGWGELLPGILLLAPVDLDLVRPHEWLDARDLRFWTHGICPAMWVTAEAILAVICLRTRQLVFWTPTARIWGGIGIAVVTIVGIGLLVGTIRGQHRSRDFTTRHGELLGELRAVLDRGTPAFHPAREPDPMPDDIHWVSVRSNPRASTRYYRREGDETDAPTIFEQFHRLPSGEWVQLETGYR